VGDLHGCFDLLTRLLAEVRFNKSYDRLFSVGDLIDRGLDSLRCLQLLAESWFYPVQGNHEKMMLDFFSPYLKEGQLKCLDDIYEDETDFLINGGIWIEQYYQPETQSMSEEFNRCLKLLSNLPLIWVVGENQARFHDLFSTISKIAVGECRGGSF